MSKDILAATKIGDVFLPNNYKEKYRELVKKWHPDKNNNSIESQEVTKKLNEWYRVAKELIDNGELWESSWHVIVPMRNRNYFIFRYRQASPFELGKMYTSSPHVVYILEEKYSKLSDNLHNVLEGLKFPTDTMKEDRATFMPGKISANISAKKCPLIVLEKSRQSFCLDDVIKHYNGAIPVRHVAWMISRLYNIVCFLEYNELAHNGITSSNYFIVPRSHSGILVGGWWYAGKQGSKMIGTVPEIYNQLPFAARKDPVNDIYNDLRAIKFLGKKLLYPSKPDVPKALLEWCTSDTEKNAVQEYALWDEVLEKSFGPKKFIVMDDIPE